MKTVIIIPARMASKRLPGKPLEKIRGIPIIYRCLWSCYNSNVKEIYVTSPDPEILWEICKRDGKAIETSDKFINGTERIAKAARILQLKKDDIVVNLQGDMPFFNPEIIDEPLRQLKALKECNVASAMTTLQDKDKSNPNRVKVVIDKEGRAVSFTREHRENAYLHIGVYVFRNSFLQKYANHYPTDEELITNLEQKRTMDMNEPIYMSYVKDRPTVIDTIEDLEAARNNL